MYWFVKNRVMRDSLRIKENCYLQFFLNVNMSCEIRDGTNLPENCRLQDMCFRNHPVCFGAYAGLEVP